MATRPSTHLLLYCCYHAKHLLLLSTPCACALRLPSTITLVATQRWLVQDLLQATGAPRPAACSPRSC
jgi:hypothetical protein